MTPEKTDQLPETSRDQKPRPSAEESKGLFESEDAVVLASLGRKDLLTVGYAVIS
jgi:hypothetical protein